MKNITTFLLAFFSFCIASTAQQADFSVSTQQVCLGQAVVFTDLSVGTINSRLWNFGNGVTSTQTNPTYSYPAAGVYTVTLTINDSITVTKNNFINVQNFQITTSHDPLCVQTSIGFEGVASASVNQWFWEFASGQSFATQTLLINYPSEQRDTVITIAISTFGCRDTVTEIINLNALPAVGFTISDASSCTFPHSVTFTDTSSNLVDWSWTFGNGNIDSIQSPTNIYNALGTYNVSLIGTDVNGCVGTRTINSAVVVALPIANISSNAVNGCKPLATTFQDISFTTDPIVSWNWSFGNGATSIAQNPSYTYNDTGSYTIQLVINTQSGCIDTGLFNGYINVGEPGTLDFSLDQTIGCHPFAVNFTDLSSPFIDQWFWDFGDGAGATTQNPSHTYTDTGFFNVSLNASFHGCPSPEELKTNVLYTKPAKPIFSADSVIDCFAPYIVNFRDTSQGAEQWTWKFGDGAQTLFGAAPAHTSHTYMNPGSYTVWLIVENFTTGCIDSASLLIRISDLVPGFTSDTNTVCTPQSISFTDTSFTTFGISAVSWTFSNSTVLNGANVSTNFAGVPGTYDVTQRVTDALGCTKQISQSSYVEILEVPNADFIATPVNGCAPLLVNFTDASTGVLGLNRWIYSYGDGTNPDTIQNGVHTYINANQYNVTLSVRDNNGCSNSTTLQNLINVTFPIPNFTIDSIQCANDSNVFNNTSVGADLTYIWNFGDGNSSMSTSPSHAYNLSNDSLLVVNLIAIDSNNCVDSIQKTIFVSAPFASFSADALIGECAPFETSFSAVGLSNNIVNSTLTFGDAGTPFSINGNTSFTYDYTYLESGVYDVSLSVTNDLGCSYVETKTSYIQVLGYGNSAQSTAIGGSCGQSFLFTAVSDNINNQLSWDFGNGEILVGDSVSYAYATQGTFTPKLYIANPSAGCFDTLVLTPLTVSAASVSVDISVLSPTPYAAASIPFMGISSSNIVNWAWNFGDSNTVESTSDTVYHSYLIEGTYPVVLTGFDANGCSGTAQSSVVVLSNSGVVMNVITPNGDGINDVLTLVNKDVKQVEFAIYNRWGEAVFSYDNAAEIIEWYGRDYAGTLVPSGTYYYTLNTLSNANVAFENHGYITVIRD